MGAGLGGAEVLLTTAGPGGDSLRGNLGLHVGDDPVLVHGRRAALARRVGRDLVWMDQTHSCDVVVIDADTSPSSLPVAGPLDPSGAPGVGPGAGQGVGPGRHSPRTHAREGEWATVAADGVVIDARGWVRAPGAAVMVADCLPVLLSDTRGEVVAAVHAGRRGLAGGILTRAVTLMAPLVGGVDHLHVLIGPSVCGRCYEVPAALRDEVAQTHPASWAETSWGTPALDLAAGAEQELRGLGVVEVRRDGRCTLEDPELHSHRRDPRSGRQVGVVVPRRGPSGRSCDDMPEALEGAEADLH